MTTYRNLTFPTDTTEEDETIGNLLFCSNDEDCGGVGFPDDNGEIISYGATCNLATCHCECSADYCLTQPFAVESFGEKPNNKDDVDIGCQFQCECKKQCIFPGDTTGETIGTCNGECTDCTGNSTRCEPDEDCIDNGDNTAKCVEAGICTAKKEDMCDDAYAAVSGKKNKRAKCCPDTRYVYISFYIPSSFDGAIIFYIVIGFI